MIVPVILCGGAGTRLWPVSKPEKPKPFLPLLAGVSTFSLTLERVTEAQCFAKPLIIASHSARQVVLKALQGKKATLLLEPVGRNTGPAVAMAALKLAKHHPDTIMLVLAADHFVSDHPGFLRTLTHALPLAAKGHIVSFGIHPTSPSEAYGYITLGKALAPHGHSVASFHEKPGAEKALVLLAAGAMWNSGNLLCKAATMWAEIERHAPDLAASLRGIRFSEKEIAVVDEALLTPCPSVSIDVAVMEKTTKAAVIRATHDWSDLGTWASVWEASPKDGHGNVIHGPVAITDTSDSLIYSDGPSIRATGLVNMTVVCGGKDVLLTAPAIEPCKLPGFATGHVVVEGHSVTRHKSWAPASRPTVVVLLHGVCTITTNNETLTMERGKPHAIAVSKSVVIKTENREPAAIVSLQSG